MTRSQAGMLEVGLIVTTALGMLVAIEFAMWNALQHWLHSMAVDAATRTGSFEEPSFIFAMVAIALPLFLAWSQAYDAGKKLQARGEDDHAMRKAESGIFRNLLLTYVVMLLCINVLRGLLP
jgi:hypothetical protein